jgi:hypothetical protein
VSVVWRKVEIQEYKLDRLKEIAGTESDWEAVDQAINRVLFTEEIHTMMDGDELDDESLDEPEDGLFSVSNDDSGLPWDA